MPKHELTLAGTVVHFDPIGRAWDVIIEMAEGGLDGLDTLCRKVGMPTATFHRALAMDKELRDNYNIARRILAQRFADEALKESAPNEDDHLIDDWGRYSGNTARIQRSALRVKTLLALAAKYDPETFGDRIINDNRESRVVLNIGSTDAAAAIYRARQAQIIDAKPVKQEE